MVVSGEPWLSRHFHLVPKCYLSSDMSLPWGGRGDSPWVLVAGWEIYLQPVVRGLWNRPSLLPLKNIKICLFG